MKTKWLLFGAVARRVSLVGLSLAIAVALVPLDAAADAAPITFVLSARLSDSGRGEPSVVVAMKNVADDDYAFYANGFLTIERKNQRFAYPLVVARNIPPIYASIPTNRTLYLVARPTQGVIAVSKSASWSELSNFREAYGAGTYRMKYCSQLADFSTFVCSNTVSVRI